MSAAEQQEAFGSGFWCQNSETCCRSSPVCSESHPAVKSWGMQPQLQGASGFGLMQVMGLPRAAQGMALLRQGQTLDWQSCGSLSLATVRHRTQLDTAGLRAAQATGFSGNICGCPCFPALGCLVATAYSSPAHPFSPLPFLALVAWLRILQALKACGFSSTVAEECVGPVTQTRTGAKRMVLLLLLGTWSCLCFVKDVQIFLRIYLARVCLRRSNKIWLKRCL